MVQDCLTDMLAIPLDGGVLRMTKDEQGFEVGRIVLELREAKLECIRSRLARHAATYRTVAAAIEVDQWQEAPNLEFLPGDAIVRLPDVDELRKFPKQRRTIQERIAELEKITTRLHIAVGPN